MWSGVSAALGLLALAWLGQACGQPLMIGSLGASAVLLFARPDSPLAQPRNLIGGHLLSALVAVGIVALFGSSPETTALGVGLAILVMGRTRTMHPPGGATALIGVQTGAGPSFVVLPALAGALILLAVALLTNNLAGDRRYPQHWD